MITFALSGHRRRIRYQVHTLALVGWAALAAGLLAAERANPTPVRTLLLSVWAPVGLLILWNAFRRGAGRETLAFGDRELVFSRRVGPFWWRRIYERSRLLSPHAVRTSIPPERQYRVLFHYDGRPRTFGDGLSAAEAGCIVALMSRPLTAGEGSSSDFFSGEFPC